MDEYEQKTSGNMNYPSKGTFNRLLFKTPLFWWRTGFGPLLSHPALGGGKMLAITTLGRVSGLPRHTMLSYAAAGGKEYVLSGWGSRSDWVKNILANPLVTVQVGRRGYTAQAYRVEDREEFTMVADEMFRTGGDSHFKPWLESYGVRYDRDDLVAKRDRVTVFGFQPVDDPGPPPLASDLRWIWLLLAALVLAIWGAVALF